MDGEGVAGGQGLGARIHPAGAEVLGGAQAGEDVLQQVGLRAQRGVEGLPFPTDGQREDHAVGPGDGVGGIGALHSV